jgi:uncharacterized protein YjiS (DUF1127 family)
MSENKNFSLRSFYEIECYARRERGRLIGAWLQDMARHGAQWVRGLARQLARLARRRAVERQRQSAVHALNSLDDRILADMGISRGEIEFVVRHGRALDFSRLLRRWQRIDSPAPAELKKAA